MNKQARVSGDVKFATGEKVDVNLPIIIFQEDESHIYYCPALDLCGYGKDENEAFESFKVVLSEYFLYTKNKKTLREDLRKLGWQIRRSLKKRMTPPTMSHLLESNENFNNIFNNHSFRKVETKVRIPAVA